MTFASKPVMRDDTLPYWDLNKYYMQQTGGGILKDSQYYTHAYVLKWHVSDKDWRTLSRSKTCDSLAVKDGSKDLGIYIYDQHGVFRDSGYDVCGHAV